MVVVNPHHCVVAVSAAPAATTATSPTTPATTPATTPTTAAATAVSVVVFAVVVPKSVLPNGVGEGLISTAVGLKFQCRGEQTSQVVKVSGQSDGVVGRGGAVVMVVRGGWVGGWTRWVVVGGTHGG